EAVMTYRTALALNPTDEMGYMKLAICLTETGKPDEAVALFEDLRRMAPRSSLVPIGLGVVTMMSGETDRARQQFQSVLDKDPQNILALQWMAVLEEDAAANPAEALRRRAEVVRLLPARHSTHSISR